MPHRQYGMILASFLIFLVDVAGASDKGASSVPYQKGIGYYPVPRASKYRPNDYKNIDPIKTDGAKDQGTLVAPPTSSETTVDQ